MTPLRKRMLEELQLRNLSRTTADSYVRAVERFAKYYNKSPEQLGPEQVRQYLLHLRNDNEVVPSTILVNRSALRFLYVQTLKQKWFDEEIARPKRRPTLPGILSARKSPAFWTAPPTSSTGPSLRLSMPLRSAAVFCRSRQTVRESSSSRRVETADSVNGLSAGA